MELSIKSKIGVLLDSYPFLLEFLIEKSPKYAKLKNPFLRKTLAGVTSLAQAASLGGLAAETLLLEIAGQIYTKTNDSITLVNPGGRSELEHGMSRDERIAVFKSIVLRVHNGESLEAVRSDFHSLLMDVSPAEIGAMEQALVADGIDESEIKKLCSLHVELFEQSLDSELPEMEPGHPLHTMQEENRLAEEKAQHLAEAAARSSDDFSYSAARPGLLAAVEELWAVVRHYERKENQLFPLMESYGLTAPPQVMWSIHDDIRSLLKQSRAALEAEDREHSLSLVGELTVAIRDLIYKEEKVLFPMTHETFSEEDWFKVRRGEEEIGFSWVKPGTVWQAPDTVDRSAETHDALVSLHAGYLRPEVLDAILQSLPVDLSFVDANDRVAYFSQTEHRIFPRSEGILGREVANCHPAKSLYMVESILEKFKTGEKDQAEFWIEMNGVFVHIRFYAIRLKDGTYEGCLEVAQDVTGIRALTGQKRLLDWE